MPHGRQGVRHCQHEVQVLRLPEVEPLPAVRVACTHGRVVLLTGMDVPSLDKGSIEWIGGLEGVEAEKGNTVGERVEAREGTCEGDAEGAGTERHARIIGFMWLNVRGGGEALRKLSEELYLIGRWLTHKH